MTETAAGALRQRAYIGLGSNLEQPARQVGEAIDRLSKLPGTELANASRLYCTPPWGDADQPSFINAAVALDTSLSPRDLLAQLQAIEAAAGRQRSRRWGPRVLDLDLLLFADQVIDGQDMRVPHPHLHERAFVLVPLAEIAPDAVVPGRGRVRDLLVTVDATGIEPLG